MERMITFEELIRQANDMIARQNELENELEKETYKIDLQLFLKHAVDYNQYLINGLTHYSRKILELNEKIKAQKETSKIPHSFFNQPYRPLTLTQQQEFITQHTGFSGKCDLLTLDAYLTGFNQHIAECKKLLEVNTELFNKFNEVVDISKKNNINNQLTAESLRLWALPEPLKSLVNNTRNDSINTNALKRNKNF